MRTGCAILAAGASRRLGFPKQLVQLCGEPLVRRAVNSALRSAATATAVIVGAHAPAVREALRPVQVVTLDNPNWNEGMAASVRVAARWAEDAGFEALLLALCDQLALNTAHLDRLLAAGENSTSIVASRYAGRRGVPALFPRRHFLELSTLRGDRGARELLSRAANVIEIAWPEGELDLDLPQDLPLAR
jgi:molybdenum cofactor cytidylyltransferase